MKLNTLALFNRLKSKPAGIWIFSRMVCFMAPYFGSISPRIEILQPGYAKVSLRMRRKVKNHIGSVHAIAMCNMAELAGGLMTDVSIPAHARWIPVGMQVLYLKKAMTDLVAEADGSAIDWTQSDGEIVVPVVVKDCHGDAVFSATIQMNLKPKK